MNDSIGSYIRSKLRSKNISNRAAAGSIGLSESAFEKILMQDDIYASRLLKLSELLKENLFEFYYNAEPISSIILAEKNEQKEALLNITDKIELLKQLVESKEELLTTQRKYILELESNHKTNSL